MTLNPRCSALVATGLFAAVAVTVHVAAAPAARAALGYRFPGVPDRPASALAILAANARVAGGILGAALVLGHAHHELGSRGVGLLRAGLDLALGLTATQTLLPLAIALGAYGTRMAAALLPHGPVELAAFALCGRAYHHARRRPVPGRELGRVALAAGGLLVLAAIAETYA